MTLLDEAVAAHGGLARWSEVARLRLRLRCGGLALAAKGQGHALRDVVAEVDLHRPRVAFAGLGTFDGGEPRPPGMSRRLRWDTRDVVHFGGYALWSYVAAPFCFVELPFRVRELPGRRLRVEFPPGVPAHCREQVFHLSPEGLIARLDYTAEVFGPWARAAHRVWAHVPFEGLVVARRRRVVPRGLPGPTLVSIAIEPLALEYRNGPARLG